jgi:catechol 2,3-dioxygenase-like lactoylglutathione lyase family enzyme
MPRGLDHIVHAVRDLDAAAELYRRLGFTVGARNRHPPTWGTQNHIVQLPGIFVELLGVADATGIAPHAARSFSFGAHNRDFLARGEGLSMMALEGRGAEDAQAFRAAGIGDFQVYDFEREAKRPDGAPTKVALSLAFASHDQAPDVGFFTSQHHYPENFWNPAFQVHGNTAKAIAAVIMVAEEPADHQAFLSAFVGEDAVQATSTGITVPTPRGVIQVMTPAAFRAHFAVAPPDLARGPRLAALRFAVRDFTATMSALKAGGIDAQVRMGRIIVGTDNGMGATLVFEPGG